MHSNDENKHVSKGWRGGFQVRKWRNWSARRLLVVIFVAALLIAAGGLALIRVIIGWIFPGFDAF